MNEENDKNDLKLKMNITYPRSDKFVFETMLVRVNLDEARVKSIREGKGFIIGPLASNIKKNLLDVNNVFSSKFGANLQDSNIFINNYRCQCGALRYRFNVGIQCDICGTKVKDVGTDFEYFGWIVLKDPFYIIHPALYRSLEQVISAPVLDNILKPIDQMDVDGYKKVPIKYKDEPYKGIGILEFKEKFDEILEYYHKKATAAKEIYYNDIIQNRDKIFTQSIPVFTTHLRPAKVDGDNLYFEGTNAIYVMMSKLQSELNKDDLKIFRKRKPKNQLLYDLHCKYMELYVEVVNTFSGKKGKFRTLLGGRYNFTSRCVIIPNPLLRIDQCTLSYFAAVELLSQSIINILQKSYSITYPAAYKIWFKAKIEVDDKVWKIIKSIINSYENGIPVLINRNPSIQFGSIMQMFVIDITDDYTLGLPLQILPSLAADFDGDVLNIMYIINKQFFEACYSVLNPRNNMYISKNDGKFNNDFNHYKDILVNSTTLTNEHRNAYSQEQIERIKQAKAMR